MTDHEHAQTCPLRGRAENATAKPGEGAARAAGKPGEGHPMSVEASTRALLDLVEAERVRQSEAVLDAARAEAAKTLAHAHADARAAALRTFTDARERLAARVDAAQAELATRQRIAEQQRIARLLAEAWQLLPAELIRRWRNPALRRQWVEHVVALAHALLPSGPWRIAHAPDWPESERTALAAVLDTPPEFVAKPAHRAGLTIASSANVIDGTLEGLIADRDEVAAQLLSELERLRAETEVTP